MQYNGLFLIFHGNCTRTRTHHIWPSFYLWILPYNFCIPFTHLKFISAFEDSIIADHYLGEDQGKQHQNKRWALSLATNYGLMISPLISQFYSCISIAPSIRCACFVDAVHLFLDFSEFFIDFVLSFEDLNLMLNIVCPVHAHTHTHTHGSHFTSKFVPKLLCTDISCWSRIRVVENYLCTPSPCNSPALLVVQMIICVHVVRWFPLSH